LLSGFDDSFSPELKPQLSPALGQLQAKHQRHSQVLSLVQIIDTLETTPLPSGRYGYHDVLHSKTPRLRQLRRTQHAALTAELTRQQKNIEQLCATHNVSHVSHIGPVTAESLAPILHKLSADGVFL